MPLKITDRLKRGDVLRMQILNGERFFWFENPYQKVSPNAFAKANHEMSIVETGDSLFGLRNNSQTWMAAIGGMQ